MAPNFTLNGELFSFHFNFSNIFSSVPLKLWILTIYLNTGLVQRHKILILPSPGHLYFNGTCSMSWINLSFKSQKKKPLWNLQLHPPNHQIQFYVYTIFDHWHHQYKPTCKVCAKICLGIHVTSYLFLHRPPGLSSEVPAYQFAMIKKVGNVSRPHFYSCVCDFFHGCGIQWQTAFFAMYCLLLWFVCQGLPSRTCCWFTIVPLQFWSCQPFIM